MAKMIRCRIIEDRLCPQWCSTRGGDYVSRDTENSWLRVKITSLPQWKKCGFLTTDTAQPGWVMVDPNTPLPDRECFDVPVAVALQHWGLSVYPVEPPLVGGSAVYRDGNGTFTVYTVKTEVGVIYTTSRSYTDVFVSWSGLLDKYKGVVNV